MVLAMIYYTSPCLDSEPAGYRVLIHMKNISNNPENNVRLLRFRVLTAVLMELPVKLPVDEWLQKFQNT
jgi:hypothetical protein